MFIIWPRVWTIRLSYTRVFPDVACSLGEIMCVCVCWYFYAFLVSTSMYYEGSSLTLFCVAFRFYAPFCFLQGKAILDGSFEPAFPLKHAQKDMRFAVVSVVLWRTVRWKNDMGVLGVRLLSGVFAEFRRLIYGSMSACGAYFRTALIFRWTKRGV